MAKAFHYRVARFGPTRFEIIEGLLICDNFIKKMKKSQSWISTQKNMDRTGAKGSCLKHNLGDPWDEILNLNCHMGGRKLTCAKAIRYHAQNRRKS